MIVISALPLLVAVGWYTTLIVQFAPAASVVPQLSYSEKGTGDPNTCVGRLTLKFIGPVPELVSVTLCGELLLPCGMVSELKSMVEAENVAMGCAVPRTYFATKTAGPLPDAKVPGVPR